MFSLSRLIIIQPLTRGIINLPQCQEHAQTGGVGEIAFLRYKDGADCGHHYSDYKCDFYFKPLQIQDEDGKVIEKIDETSTTYDTYDVDLTKVTELQNPIQINIPTNKTVKIFASVWDDDGVFRDKIRDIIDFKLSFDTILVGDNWKPATKNIGNTVTFKVEYKLTRCDDNFTGLGCNFCKVNYFTQLCDKYCKPQVGNYTCNTTTGDKVCENNRVGKNCDVCRDHFTGVDCNQCVKHFFPAGICDVECVPIAGQYICNDQGGKLCQGNWNGTDCDSCAANYYGTNCTKFCNTTSTNYTCDLYGNRTCNNNYYPEQQCDKYCYPVDKIYSCNQTTGDKICKGNRAGEECEECLQNFYPQGDCTVFCRPAQGQYTCSSTGDIQCVGNRRGDNCSSCLDNYYGSGCEKYCKENMFYTCTDAGDKIFINPDAIKAGAGTAGAVLLILLVVGIFVALRIRRNRKLDKITGDALELVENPGALYETIDETPSPRSYETLDQGDGNNKLDKNKSKSTPADQGNEKVEEDCDEENSYVDHVVPIATQKEDTYSYAIFNRGTRSNFITEAQYEESEEENEYADVTITQQPDDTGTYANLEFV